MAAQSADLLLSRGSQAFTKLPDTSDEIDSRLNEERSRAECFTGLSENVRIVPENVPSGSTQRPARGLWK